MQTVVVFLKSWEWLCYLRSNGKMKIAKTFWVLALHFCMFSDKSNKHLKQNIATTRDLRKMFSINIFDLRV